MTGLIFAIALIAMLGGSYLLTVALDGIGLRLGLSAGMMGLLTALGSDTPEIVSALTALVKGEHEVGVGVVLGSNMFNLAGLMGVGALVGHGLPLSRGPLLLNTVTSLLVTAVAALLLGRLLPPSWSLVLLGAIFLPYVLILWIDPRAEVGEPAGLLGRLRRWHGLVRVAREPDTEASPTPAGSAPRLILRTVGSLALIVVGAVFTVHTALLLGAQLHIPRGLVGSVGLAALSSVPNVLTAANLARQGRGTAVVSETVNSNTVNVLVGLGLPAVVFGVAAPSVVSLCELGWLFLMTAAALLLSVRRARLSPLGGVTLLALYAIFVVGRVLWH